LFAFFPPTVSTFFFFSLSRGEPFPMSGMGVPDDFSGPFMYYSSGRDERPLLLAPSHFVGYPWPPQATQCLLFFLGLFLYDWPPHHPGNAVFWVVFFFFFFFVLFFLGGVFFCFFFFGFNGFDGDFSVAERSVAFFESQTQPTQDLLWRVAFDASSFDPVSPSAIFCLPSPSLTGPAYG